MPRTSAAPGAALGKASQKLCCTEPRAAIQAMEIVRRIGNGSIKPYSLSVPTC